MSRIRGTTVGLVLRRLGSNRWLTICLLAGVVVAVSLVSSIPLYTQGVLQRVFVKAMEEFQRSSGEFPGRYLVQTSLATSAAVEYKTIAAYREYDDRLERSMIPSLGIPVLTRAHRVSAGLFSAAPVKRSDGELDRILTLDSMRGLEEHARFLLGRPPAPERAGDGAIEFVVSEGCYERHTLELGADYLTPSLTNRDGRPFLLRLVGVFTVSESRDQYWYAGIGAYESSAFVPLALFHETFVDSGLVQNLETEWFYALDYHAMTVAELGPVSRALRSQVRLFDEYRISYRIAALPLIQAYFSRETALRLILGLLDAPILVLLAIYVYVVSHFIVENDRNEIAVLKSRGATTLQVFRLYVTQGALLAAVALAAGPPLGLLLCSVIGSSSGFMQFVQRRALPVGLTPAGYAYALVAAAVFMLSTLAPAIAASRFSIVEHKKRRGRSSGAPLWRRLFLDAILLGVAAYGYYQFRARQRVLEVTGWEGAELPLDPALFLVCAAFVLGAALLYLRVFPLAVRAVFRIGHRFWRPSTYASLIHVSRSVGQEAFFMLFFTAAIALGLFAATSARTINRNVEERIRYSLGAELVVREDWGQGGQAAPAAPGMAGGGPVAIGREIREPPFGRFLEIPGIEAASPVFRKGEASFRSGGVSGSSSLMGIVPHEFGAVAWLRRGLVPEWTGAELELMSARPWLALVSRSFETEHGLQRGDVLELSWSGQGIVLVTIQGFFDYWPTFNPRARDRAARGLVVANLDYLRMNTVPEPYEVWMKAAEGSSTQAIYDTLGGEDYRVLEVSSASQEVVRQRNDAILQGTNGALTVGFVVTLALCGVGFLLYSVLSFQRRVLQFGVLRAIGVGGAELVGMLVAEQLLTTGSAALVGLAVGEAASALFVPLTELASSAASQVPPFRVATDPGDYLRLLGAVLASVTAGICTLAVLLRRLKITQALKLGEE